ncbi:putative lipid II flippase FtsW [Subtercola boreus]|uniref:Probable peptidoglycan glycosyltransferase FtsW n=2 Tax=Subtercola boreus TaxID=120213 RepID=A0A3E0VX32_9MICO|nr:putative lipid II flippase FtsW [Subtercola boreus]
MRRPQGTRPNKPAAGTRPPAASGAARPSAATGTRPSAATFASTGASRARTARISVNRVFQAESSNYYFLLGTTLFLVVLGLVMVLSSSSIDSYTARQGFFGTFWKQGVFALIGVPLMLVISRLPIRFWKRWGWLALAGGVILQLLVLFTPLGITVGGNLNWLNVAGVSLQPSELIKLGLVIWMGVILAKKQRYLHLWGHVAIPVLPVAGGAVLLVMLGGDLGTVMIMAGLLFGALFFAGIRLRMFIIPVILGGIAIALIAASSSSRVSRIGSFLSEGCTDYSGECWQTQHGLFALANGGFFGVGLGNSKAKWSWLPAADNDFIFAIIGEELGMIGALVVIALFVALAIAFLRIVRSSKDMFSKVVSGSVMVWIISQAFVNIAVVLGVIPVLGVPLPLISSGGSALITTLIAIGVVLSIARGQTKETASDPDAGALLAPGSVSLASRRRTVRPK